MAKYATFDDYVKDQLIGGPDSTRLEFKPSYYEDNVRLTGGRLIAALRSDSDAPRLMAVGRAATTAMDLLHPEFGSNHLDPGYKGMERRFEDAARLAIELYRESPEFDVETLTLEGTLNIPSTELHEVGRLAIQKYRVYTGLAETGEVPQL